MIVIKRGLVVNSIVSPSYKQTSSHVMPPQLTEEFLRKRSGEILVDKSKKVSIFNKVAESDFPTFEPSRKCFLSASLRTLHVFITNYFTVLLLYQSQ